jgi:hypothetical protein
MGVPIYHGWYDRGKVGMHHQMVDNVVHAYGLSKQATVALKVMLGNEWEAARNNIKKWLETAQLACFVLVDYTWALRGEDIMNIE